MFRFPKRVSPSTPSGLFAHKLFGCKIQIVSTPLGGIMYNNKLVWPNSQLMLGSITSYLKRLRTQGLKEGSLLIVSCSDLLPAFKTFWNIRSALLVKRRRQRANDRRFDLACRRLTMPDWIWCKTPLEVLDWADVCVPWDTRDAVLGHADGRRDAHADGCRDPDPDATEAFEAPRKGTEVEAFGTEPPYIKHTVTFCCKEIRQSTSRMQSYLIVFCLRVHANNKRCFQRYTSQECTRKGKVPFLVYERYLR